MQAPPPRADPLGRESTAALGRLIGRMAEDREAALRAIWRLHNSGFWTWGQACLAARSAAEEHGRVL